MTTSASNNQTRDPETGDVHIPSMENKDIAANNKSGKRDAIASAFAALSFVVGFALYSTVLFDLADDDITSLEELKVIKDNEQIYYLSNMILYIFFGIAQLALSIGMATASSAMFPATSSLAKAFGIIWSTLVIAAGMVGNIGANEALDLYEKDPEGAASLWKVIQTIHSGIGGGNEIVGGIWVLMAGWLYFKTLPCDKIAFIDKIVLVLTNFAGWTGILSTVPIMAESTTVVFGVSMIVWYALFGILMFFRS